MTRFDRGKIKNDGLTVEAIFDLRTNLNANAVHAATYIQTLSEAEWTELRVEATRTGNTANPLFRCGDCRKAVYGRVSANGRRHFYHFKGDHSDCRWSGAVAESMRSIDAEKFHGQQEGERHKSLSRFVAEILSLDPASEKAGVFFRRYTKLEDGQYAYPDVFTSDWQGGPAAFEIQLATTHMPVIARRDAFYEKAGIRLMWIFGGSDDLDRRTFRDIYMRNDGQIFCVDGDVLRAARAAGEPRFRLYRLLPSSAANGFKPAWQNTIVGPAEISWGSSNSRPFIQPNYDRCLDQLVEADRSLSSLRDEFYAALTIADEGRAGAAWDKIATLVGGVNWNEVPSPRDTVRALGALASVRIGRLCIPTDIEITNLPHLVNTILLEPRERRIWTHAFELLCKSLGLRQLLERPSVRGKCDRNGSEAVGKIPIDRLTATTFDVLFPEGAFRRLSLDFSEHRAE
ncbi:DUF6035 family protein [Dongia sp.]|uniref:DUF6035 family protein n=1 Tax=Dongia sp. TaxID=1977262 RepID=UPI0037521CB5